MILDHEVALVKDKLPLISINCIVVPVTHWE